MSRVGRSLEKLVGEVDKRHYSPGFFIKRLVRYKIYIDRARGYVGYVQFLMLAVIMAKQFNVKLGLWGSVLLVIAFFLGCLVVGFIDTWLGIRAEENRNTNEQNPQLLEILKVVNELKDCRGDSCTREAPAAPEDH